MQQLYVQLLGIGILWVMFHCSGMCGPIMAGLVTYEVHDPKDSSTKARLWRRFKAVLSYQSGRAITYGLIGAMIGGAGASIQHTTREVSKLAGLVAGAIMFFIALRQLILLIRGKASPQAQSLSARWGAALGQLVRKLQRRLPKQGPLRMMLYGGVLGLMPCMLMFWVMNLAMSSASMLHGALLMMGLVVLTTPTLVGAACLTAVKRHSWKRFGEYVAPIALMFSGLWITMMAIAANGWIEHYHFLFSLGGERYTIMFF